MRVRCTIDVLLELGFKVDLLALPYGENVEAKGLTTHRTVRIPWIKSVPIGPSWSKLLYGILLSITAMKLCYFRGVRYSAIHGIEEGGVIAAVLGTIGRKPFVFDMHSQMSEQIKDKKLPKLLSGFVSLLERFSIQKAGAVVTVADHLTEYAKKISPKTPAESIQDIPLASSNQIDSGNVATYRQNLAADNSKIFVYTGNFEQYQGVDLLLRAFQKINQNSTCAYTLILVGGGEPEVDPQRVKLEKLAEVLGVRQSVVFAGAKPIEAMGDFMALADVLVSPRVSGANTPLKIYSYMESEKPIVATNISSHVQVLDSNSAYLCEPNEDSLAQAMMESCVESEEATAKRAKLIAKAKHLVVTKYSRECFKEKLGNLYNSFASERAQADEFAQEFRYARRKISSGGMVWLSIELFEIEFVEALLCLGCNL